MIPSQKLDAMTEDEEIVERKDHRNPFPPCNPHQVCGKSKDVLKVDETGLPCPENLQEDPVKEVVVVKDPSIRHPGQIIHHPGHSDAIRLLIGKRKLFLLGIFFTAKDVDLMIQIGQCL
jgi:hypothetical protein